MKEITDVRQIAGEPQRRWFSSNEMDLIVWLDEQQQLIGFELCYDKLHSEHALVWNAEQGLRHMAVDDGEGRAGKYKASPILISNGLIDWPRLLPVLHRSLGTLPNSISTGVRVILERASTALF